MSKPAPIIFLLGTSTAGKSTICEEISRQDKASENLGFETWGMDKEGGNETLRCQNLLGDDSRFLAIKDKFPNPWQVIAGVYLSEVKDAKTGELLQLNDDEKFAGKLDDFLAQTEGRYDKEALEILKTLAKENPNNFREKADLTPEGRWVRAFERAVDHAIENSKRGKPTILDMVPNSAGGDLVADFEAHLVKRNFTCPTHVVLVHLSVVDLIERMDQRNQKALAEGGNPDDQRTEIFPFEQYSTIFGASARDVVAVLRSEDIHQAVEKFGGTEKPRVEKELLDRLGFEEGQTLITVSAKVKADVVCEHSDPGSTVKIAEAIYSWTNEQAREGGEKAETFAERYPSCKDGGKSADEGRK